jgi:(p)ppGpp synthase/HD superfamily hydrolase
MAMDDLIVRATTLASALHARQVRKGSLVGVEVPYLSHLLEVAGMVLANGGTPTVCAAALLHDAIEDQGAATRPLIEKQLGTEVLRLVEACTEQGTGGMIKAPWAERKQAYIAHIAHTPAPALLIVVADKLQSARELLRLLRRAQQQGGPEATGLVWSKFKGGREGTLWFHQEVVKALQHRLAESPPGAAAVPMLIGARVLTEELAEVVDRLARE